MKGNRKIFGTVVASSLIVSMLGLAGCNKPATTDADTAASAASAASAPQPASAATPPYTPPTAAQLEQMVAPIALFPDKLVAQVLAGSTYPDQITAANQWLAQNPSLKGDALQNAANQQPWDPSVKSLTAFPAVLNQMAGNIQWTTALGEAYVNDPNDVMNAIQVMRQRAQQSGNLKSSKQIAVSAVARTQPAPQVYTNEGDEPPVYAGPAVIAPPQQTIVIEPAQPDVVYVPTYNPAVVYGAPVPVYPGYAYSAPAYSTGDVVAAGVISFGVGVIVGSAISHHYDWGWHSWGVNWGGHGDGYGGGGGGWHRPAVVYNNNTYVSKSTTVINHITNVTNVNNTRITNNYGATNNNNFVRNNTVNNNPGNNPARPNFAQAQMQQQQHGPMTVPHFTQNDMRQGARPAMPAVPAQGNQRTGELPRPAVRENFAEGQRPANGVPSPQRNEEARQQQAAREAQMNGAQRQQEENAAAQRNAQQRQEQAQQEQRQQEGQRQEQQQQQQRQQEAQRQEQAQQQQRQQEAQQQQRQQEAQRQQQAQQQQHQQEAQRQQQAQQQQRQQEAQRQQQAQQQQRAEAQQREAQRAQPRPQPHPQQRQEEHHDEHSH